MSITVEHITKRFGNYLALDKVSHSFPFGQLTALLGPSGSGKTTLLRTIAGLDFADSGRVLFEGEDATDSHARHRGVGFVFQHYALFRHMTVAENVAFGLRVKPRAVRPSREEIRTRVRDLLKLVQIDWLGNRRPHQLSGGQRQRVALARALAVEPKVLLLDEPFGALDANVRKELRRWLRRLHDEIHVTSIFVTHDVEEALEVADEIVVLNEGRIEQVGAPEWVYDHPATPFVFRFLGSTNQIHPASLPEFSALRHAVPSERVAPSYVRPHEFDVLTEPTEGSIQAIISDIRTIGPTMRLDLKTVSTEDVLEVEIDKETGRALALRAESTVYVRPRRLKTYGRTGGNADGYVKPSTPGRHGRGE